MKKTTCFLFFLLLTGSILYAQPPIQWQKSLGGTSYDGCTGVQTTNDGGCIIVGASGSFDGDVTGNHGNDDGWIVKLDMNGDIEWERTVGGSSNDNLKAVSLTPDGGYIVAGYTSSADGDVVGFHGGPFGDMSWVLKLDSMGNIEWNNCYGGTGEDGADNIALTSDGGYIFSGTTNSTDGDVTGYHPGTDPFRSPYDIWVVKINSIGLLQWQKCLGGSKEEYVSAIKQTVDNGYIVCGGTSGSYDGDVIGNTDTVSSATTAVSSIWIVKLDSAQNIVWQKTYGGSEGEKSKGLLLHEDNGYTFCGSTNSPDGDVIGYIGDSIYKVFNYWLVNIDSSGVIQWQKCYGGDTSNMDLNGGRLARTSGGGYAIGGAILGSESDFPGYHVDPLNSISTDLVVIVSDSIGNLEYQHCYGGFSNDAGIGIDIAVASDNGMFVVGNSNSNDGDVSGHHGPLSSEDIWVIKLAPIIANVAHPAKPLHLFKVYPNPVTNSAKISFYLPVASNVSVNIYDVTGKEAKSLLNEHLNSGYQELNWNCTTNDQQDVANGIFIVRIAAGEYSSNVKITVVR